MFRYPEVGGFSSLIQQPTGTNTPGLTVTVTVIIESPSFLIISIFTKCICLLTNHVILTHSRISSGTH